MFTVKLGNVERVVSAEALEEYKRLGFVQIDEPEAEVEEEPKELIDYTVSEVKAVTKELGISNYSSVNKEDILKRISEHSG